MANKILMCEDLGCGYQINDGVLEFAPMLQNGEIEMDNFNPVEPELIGEEIATFRGEEMTFYEIYEIVTRELELMLT